MIDIEPTQHLANADDSPLVQEVAARLHCGTAMASDVVAHLIRLSTTNPIIVWDGRRQAWQGVHYKR
jgi:hypothetical protein